MLFVNNLLFPFCLKSMQHIGQKSNEKELKESHVSICLQIMVRLTHQNCSFHVNTGAFDRTQGLKAVM